MRVRGGGGVELHVEEAGRRAGRPVVFLHGYSQSALAWRRQLAGPLARELRLVAVDLRGHGRSGKPATGYGEAATWAADVRAVVDTLELVDPVLVGWSYGGAVACDALRHGLRPAAMVLVAAATDVGTARARALSGQQFLALLPGLVSTEVGDSVAALSALTRLCTEAERPWPEVVATLGAGVLVPPHVRRALFARRCDNDDVLSAYGGPVLQVHGARDRVVLPGASLRRAPLLSDGTLSVYEGVGHMPFLEDPERFDAELARLVRRAGSLRLR
ncbi:MAG TPA: alpha/beta hydrolase [Frankiaceae bacterium]|nr:alpha/beta hydrolase [Frankiaceae bacterium]